MNAGRKNSSLTPKKAAKPAENLNCSDACRLCDINFKISRGDFGGKNKYISTENLFKIPQRAGVGKIPLADLLKKHLDVEVLYLFPLKNKINQRISYKRIRTENNFGDQSDKIERT